MRSLSREAYCNNGGAYHWSIHLCSLQYLGKCVQLLHLAASCRAESKTDDAWLGCAEHMRRCCPRDGDVSDTTSNVVRCRVQAGKDVTPRVNR